MATTNFYYFDVLYMYMLLCSYRNVFQKSARSTFPQRKPWEARFVKLFSVFVIIVSVCLYFVFGTIIISSSVGRSRGVQ